METSDNKHTDVLLVLTLQSVQDLCLLEVSVFPQDEYNSSAKSMFYWRILKCRQLIIREPEVIACPLLESENKIHVIMTWKFYRSDKILSHLTELEMFADEPQPVSKLIYENCLRYTICAQMAPVWNQVGNYLVHGRDFLVANSLLEAVQLDICIKDNGAFVTLWPVKIKLQPANLENLAIPEKVMEDFLSKNTNEISDIHLSQWVHVLPSLKRGRVVCISRHIPESCPYTSYKELKKHWKNMYGYTFPGEDENMFYFSISFHPSSRVRYTYPSLCVQSQNILLLSPQNRISILRCFYNALLIRLPRVCGELVQGKLACAFTNPNSSNMRVNNPSDQNFMNLQFKEIDMKEDVVEANNDKKNPPESQVIAPDMHSPVSQSSHSKPLENNSNIGTNIVTNLEAPSQSLQNVLPSLDTVKENIQPPIFKRKLRYSERRPSEKNEICATQSTDLQKHTPLSTLNYNIQQNEEHVLLNHVQRGTSQTEMIQEIHQSGSQNEKNIFSFNTMQSVMSSPVSDLGFLEQVSFPGYDLQEPVIKKVRTRPQIQVGLDVEYLARNNELARVNTATLVFWLRDRQIPCKVKDKKSELVNKVMEYLNLTPVLELTDR